jgi:hypothetical protein
VPVVVGIGIGFDVPVTTSARQKATFVSALAHVTELPVPARACTVAALNFYAPFCI